VGLPDLGVFGFIELLSFFGVKGAALSSFFFLLTVLFVGKETSTKEVLPFRFARVHIEVGVFTSNGNSSSGLVVF
jgi:hypothetical protein